MSGTPDLVGRPQSGGTASTEGRPPETWGADPKFPPTALRGEALALQESLKEDGSPNWVATFKRIVARRIGR